MALSRGSRPARPEAGFALIEVVVSALIMVAVTGGVVKLITASGRTGADQRHRAQAYAVAQEDQARMRGMQISSLNRYERKEAPVSVGGEIYKVTSRAFFVNDATAEASCEAGNNSADYVRISSEVDWASRPKALRSVLIESIVSPATGSLDPTHGALAIEALNASGQPISGVGINASGPQPFSGSTDSAGCALFPDLVEGNYDITPTLGAGYVEESGDPPQVVEDVGVVRNGTSTKILHYDLEGKIGLSPTVKSYANSSLIPSSIESARLINTGFKGAAEKTVAPTSTSPQIIKSLYPFGSAFQYSLYAGSCKESKPPTAGAWITSVSVLSNQTVAATLQLPPLYIKAWTGRNSSNAGLPLEKAEVWATSETCPGVIKRPTNSFGQLDNPGFPWARYDLCVDTVIGSSSSSRRQRIINKDAKSLTSGPTSNFYLGSGTSTVSETGNCP